MCEECVSVQQCGLLLSPPVVCCHYNFIDELLSQMKPCVSEIQIRLTSALQ